MYIYFLYHGHSYRICHWPTDRSESLLFILPNVSATVLACFTSQLKLLEPCNVIGGWPCQPQPLCLYVTVATKLHPSAAYISFLIMKGKLDCWSWLKKNSFIAKWGLPVIRPFIKRQIASPISLKCKILTIKYAECIEYVHSQPIKPNAVLFLRCSCMCIIFQISLFILAQGFRSPLEVASPTS